MPVGFASSPEPNSVFGRKSARPAPEGGGLYDHKKTDPAPEVPKLSLGKEQRGPDRCFCCSGGLGVQMELSESRPRSRGWEATVGSVLRGAPWPPAGTCMRRGPVRTGLG